MNSSARPPIFLSSCFEDPEGQRLGIRDRILNLTGGMQRDPSLPGRPVWVAEDHPELLPQSPWPTYEKAQLCLDGVREAECFVAIVTQRHGTPIKFDDAGSVPSSFFEAELFEAALLGKPSFVFLLDGFEPDPKLASLLRLLAPFFPNMNLRPMSEDQIIKEIGRLVKDYERPRWLRPFSTPPHLGLALRKLFQMRHSEYDTNFEAPPLRFLGGLFDPVLPVPDTHLIDTVLDRAISTPGNHARLTLLWFAIRALMGAPYNDPKSSEFLGLWDRAFSAWNSAGAWYGMHGHTTMGCLAALGSLTEVRARSNDSSRLSQVIPHGPLASEYYSIARLAGRSRKLLALSLNHIEAALVVDGDNTDGHFAIRGSIYRELGIKDASLADYARVTELRRNTGGAAYGEALSELGYAMVCFGQVRQGMMFMERGADLFKDAPASGFKIRATRKLAIGYARCGKFSSAIDQAVEAHRLAMELGAYDQIRTLDRLAVQIDSIRGRLRS